LRTQFLRHLPPKKSGGKAKVEMCFPACKDAIQFFNYRLTQYQQQPNQQAATLKSTHLLNIGKKRLRR